jgi:hypothetical protein
MARAMVTQREKVMPRQANAALVDIEPRWCEGYRHPGEVEERDPTADRVLRIFTASTAWVARPVRRRLPCS